MENKGIETLFFPSLDKERGSGIALQLHSPSRQTKKNLYNYLHTYTIYKPDNFCYKNRFENFVLVLFAILIECSRDEGFGWVYVKNCYVRC